MFALLSTYLLAAFGYYWRHRQKAVEDGARLNIPRAWLDERVVRRGQRWAPVAMVLGGLYGLAGNSMLLDRLTETQSLAIDLAMILSNLSLWILIAWTLAQTLGSALGWREAGARATVDLYRLDDVAVFGRVATGGVLLVVGALVFIPLQSLDGEFRWDNYQFGLIVGLPAAVLLFLLPMWGVRGQILRAREQRVRELRERLASTPRTDVAELEAVGNHLERIRTLPGWPIDVRVWFKFLFYLVIPPLAWVAAALVEQWVDQVLG